MIEVHNLTKDYGPHRAIDGLNFSIGQGEVVGFLGPNGAGKSTTMRILTGAMAPSEGVARVADRDVFEHPLEVKKRLGYLPEKPPLYPDMRVEDYLTFVARLKKVKSLHIRDFVAQALKQTDLSDVRSRVIQNLSRGYQQRVGLAGALVSQPEILILDEPTVGLDPKQVVEIRELINSLRKKHTIVLSTHILPEVEAVCERIIIIDKGQIVAQNTLGELSSLKKEGKSRIHLRVARPDRLNITTLSQIQGVHHASGDHDPQSLTVEADAAETVLENLAAEIVGSGAGLLEIQAEKANLEDIFIQLTYDRQASETSTQEGLL